MQLYVMDLYRRFKECGSVAVELQAMENGGLFFDFSEGCSDSVNALERGAACVVVSSASGVAVSGDSRYFPVDDVLTALHDLARWHRSMSFIDGRPLPVVALTGFDGVGAVKDAVSEILSARFEVTATLGDADDMLTLPLTLLRIAPSTKVAVVSFAAGESGDILRMSNVALPNYGLITSVSDETKEIFGELYAYLRRTSDKVFLDSSDPVLCEMASEKGLHYDPERSDSLVVAYEGDAAMALGRYFGSI